jgi:transposase
MMSNKQEEWEKELKEWWYGKSRTCEQARHWFKEHLKQARIEGMHDGMTIHEKNCKCEEKIKQARRETADRFLKETESIENMNHHDRVWENIRALANQIITENQNE